MNTMIIILICVTIGAAALIGLVIAIVNYQEEHCKPHNKKPCRKSYSSDESSSKNSYISSTVSTKTEKPKQYNSTTYTYKPYEHKNTTNSEKSKQTNYSYTSSYNYTDYGPNFTFSDNGKIYDKDKEESKYSAKNSMTDIEKKFWEQLNKLFEKDFIVTPQVPLSSIIKKNTDNHYANELYRTIDFGIFTKRSYQLVALIEINDNTHLQKNRMARDYKVKEILKDAGLLDKLITLWMNMPNTDDYVYKRVMDAGRS